MRIVYPIEFELNPKDMDNGIHWVSLRLKNIGNEELENLNIKAHTLDSYSINILGTEQHVSKLSPNEETIISFQIEAAVTGEVYASVSASTSKGPVSIDSPWVTINVVGNAAELVSVFAMTMPYTLMGQPVKVEAIVKGLSYSENLDLEFWARKPAGDVVVLCRIAIGKLSGGEKQRYSAELIPREEGFYTIQAYLYDHNKRIGLKTDMIWVEKQLTAHSPLPCEDDRAH